jgi:ribose transport system permease protein
MPASIEKPAAAQDSEHVQVLRTRRQKTSGALLILERFGLVFVLIGLIIGFSILRPSTFPTLDNWQTILVSQSVIAMGALGLVVPLVGGRFDISVGANLGMCSIACAAVMAKTSLPLSVAVLVAFSIGTLVGFTNGFIIGFLGVSSLIATLGTATIMTGLVSLYTSGIPISDGISSALTTLSVDDTLGVPKIFIAVLLVSVAVWYLLSQTAYGRRLAAVGVNPVAARLVGISVRRTVVLSFAASGALAGLAGVLAVAQQGNGNPQLGGVEFILPALAAAFLGATVFSPGHYNIPGTLVGVLFVGTAISGLALLGVAPWVEQVFNGCAVIAAVSLSQYFRRQRTGEAEIGS